MSFRYIINAERVKKMSLNHILELVFHSLKTVLVSRLVDDILRVHLWVPVQRQSVSDLLMRKPTFFEHHFLMRSSRT